MFQRFVQAVLACSLLLSTASFSQQVCPPPQQPVLSQVFQAMLRARRPDDAIACVRSIKKSHAVSEMSDEVRYQLAQGMSDAMSLLYEDTAPFPDDARDAAELWAEYVDAVALPYDLRRINIGVIRVIQYSRYSSFPDRIPLLVRGIDKAKLGLSTDTSDQFFSALKRCPNWTKVSKQLTCLTQCMDLVSRTLNDLTAQLGEPPWTASAGLARLSTNAAAIAAERQTCVRQ